MEKVGSIPSSFGLQWSNLFTKSNTVSIPALFTVPGGPGRPERNLVPGYGTEESPVRGARYSPALQSVRAAQSSRARASISAAAGGARAGGGVAGLGLPAAELEVALCEVCERILKLAASRLTTGS